MVMETDIKESELKVWRKYFPVSAFPPGYFPPNYWPKTGSSGHGRPGYAGRLLLHLMMEEEAKKKRKESPEQTRKRLIDEVIARITREDADDLTMILAL